MAQQVRMTRLALFVLWLTVSIATPGVLWAQGATLPHAATLASVDRTRTYGPNITSHTISAFGFTGYSAQDSARFAANSLGSRYCTSTPCFFAAPLNLPAGASLRSIVLDACDQSLSGEIIFSLLAVQSTEGATIPLGGFATGNNSVGDGCELYSGAVAGTVDNEIYSYFLQVGLTGSPAGGMRFQSVRVTYELQVSPAPGTATFNDVPTTHPFFPFIEALVAAGVTSGCSVSPPLFCPDGVVTRKQMAAFLSKALGLHWAP